MSTEHQAEEKRCPNCGHIADNNYCPQCGQATHLHKDTFWGMVVHFVGHYFHYDSKFWQTLKDLVKHPGKLTIAYWEKKRARYLPPISLYIFVSIVFFLLAGVVGSFYEKRDMGSGQVPKLVVEPDSASAMPYTLMSDAQMDSIKHKMQDSLGTVMGYLQYATVKLERDAGDEDRLESKMKSYSPKIFFFMIPVMASILGLLFMRRKGVYFVHHAVYSLHYHSFFFIAYLLFQVLLPSKIPIGEGKYLPVGLLFVLIFIVWTIGYSVKALRNVYKIGRFKAYLYTIILGSIYSLILGITTLIVATVIALMA